MKTKPVDIHNWIRRFLRCEINCDGIAMHSLSKGTTFLMMKVLSFITLSVILIYPGVYMHD
jgi:hypothetical protein